MTIPLSLRKRLTLIAAPLMACAAAALLGSCEDNPPTVGGALASGEVQIALDSLVWDGSEQTIHRGAQQKKVLCPKISYSTVFDDAIDARSAINLLGRISVPEYGDLNCSFVSRLMSATTLDIPDSIRYKPERIDSMKLRLIVPRGALTGDSLAPQQLTVYRLTKSLPSDIDNRFNPTGYYDPARPLGSRSFTLSALGMNDSIYKKRTYVSIEIPMSREMALETVEAYNNPATNGVFQWPQTFEQYFHGIYVEPSFGRGCVANIALTDFIIYYHYYKSKTTTKDDGTVSTTVSTEVGGTGVFGSSPIVLSSNNVVYSPSEHLQAMAARNDALVTSPGGYRIHLRFPGRELVDIYRESQSQLSVVSNLSFSIPVEEIENDYDITPPPYLIMVKSSKLNEFLASNSLPDGKDSFYAQYKNKRYSFTSMRGYILDLIQNGVKDEDLDFTIIPANIEFEQEQASSTSSYDAYIAMIYGGYYGSTSSSSSSDPIKCTPYIAKPSMCRLKMDEARTIFTYSSQIMK